jgi:hypothetical protein
MRPHHQYRILIMAAAFAIVGLAFFAGYAGLRSQETSHDQGNAVTKKRASPKGQTAASQNERGTERAPIVVKVLPAKNADEIADDNRKREDDKASNDRIVAISAASLTVVTILLVIFTARPWSATHTLVGSAERASREQLAHGRDVNRAYLGAGGDFPDKTARFFNVDFENNGKTPAFILSFDVHPAIKSTARAH